MRTQQMYVLVPVSTATILLLATPHVTTAQDVIVKNEPSAAVPVVPAPGMAPFQKWVRMGPGDNFLRHVVGPLAPGTQVAITGFTAANNGNTSTVLWLSMTPASARGGTPACDPDSPGETLTTVHVRARDTVHLGYTQPLPAPPAASDAHWCLAVSASPRGQATIIGYVK